MGRRGVIIIVVVVVMTVAVLVLVLVLGVIAAAGRRSSSLLYHQITVNQNTNSRVTHPSVSFLFVCVGGGEARLY